LVLLLDGEVDRALPFDDEIWIALVPEEELEAFGGVVLGR